MRNCHKPRFIIILSLMLALFILPAQAAQVTLTRQESGESFVEVPQVELSEAAAASGGVNALLMQAVSGHLNTLKVLQAGTAGTLRVTARTHLFEGVDGASLLSVLFSAEGRMPNGRPGHQTIPLMVDVNTGLKVEAGAFFTDTTQAEKTLEEISLDIFSQDLSNYLDLDALSPFPIERLLLSPEGLSFYYPDGGLTWLSGRAASITFYFHELEGLLNLGPDSLLTRLGVLDGLALTDTSRQSIFESVEQGRLPGLDARLGGDLESLTAENKLKYDPEGFPDAQSYSLEEDRYRGVLVLSKDGQTVSGILARRMNLLGLVTGQTRREEALDVLGEPDAAVTMESGLASLYSLPEGQMDTYFADGNQLRLHYDAQGVLNAIWLQSAP